MIASISQCISDQICGMDPFEEGLSAMDRFCLSNSTNDQRSTSTQSESSGGLERLSSSAGPDKRRRHIVRSGGTKGTEIITCYKEPKTTATPSLAGKRAWTDAASQHNQAEVCRAHQRTLVLKSGLRLL